MAAYDVISVVPAVPVASVAAGVAVTTVTFNYPTPPMVGVVQTVAADDYVQDSGAVLFSRANQNSYVQNVDFTLAFGEGSVVMTWINSSVVLPPQTRATTSAQMHDSVLRLQLTRQKNAILENAGNVPPFPSGDQAFFA